jgi:aminoglycoside phosphotransferase (APT) family kinase protein
MRQASCACFPKPGFPALRTQIPLGDGEFNAVYLVSTQEMQYVLKIAPLDSAPVMTYERGMMQSEVFWYSVMREHTKIRVPNVIRSDFSRTLLPVPFFIMSFYPETR